MIRKVSERPVYRVFCRFTGLFIPAFLFWGAMYTPLEAQSQKTITIVMLDAKTGRQLVPYNYIVRLDHLDTIHNEALQIGSDGTGKVTVPANSSYLSVQGTYEHGIEIYINCDAGMERDTSTLHWYPIDDIVNSGLTTHNECYKGKYAKATTTPAIPGEFIFFVREISWRDGHGD
jgi:hypothetical protein